MIWRRAQSVPSSEWRAQSVAGTVYVIARYFGQSRKAGQWRVSRLTEEETLYWATTLAGAKLLAEACAKQEEDAKA